MPYHPPEGQGEGASVPILELPPGKTRKVLFLGSYRGSLQHYVRGRTVFCHGRKDGCPHCSKERIVYYAYAPGRYYVPERDSWEAVVIQATANLEEALRGRRIRGEVWTLTRDVRKDGRGPVRGAYQMTLPDDALTPHFSVIPTLQRVFGTLEVGPDMPNPAPDRLYVPPVKIRIPELDQLARPTTPPATTQDAPVIPPGAPRHESESEEAYRERERKEFRERSLKNGRH